MTGGLNTSFAFANFSGMAVAIFPRKLFAPLTGAFSPIVYATRETFAVIFFLTPTIVFRNEVFFFYFYAYFETPAAILPFLPATGFLPLNFATPHPKPSYMPQVVK